MPEMSLSDVIGHSIILLGLTIELMHFSQVPLIYIKNKVLHEI